MGRAGSRSKARRRQRRRSTALPRSGPKSSAATEKATGWRAFLATEHVAVALICLAPAAIVPGGENRFVFAKVALAAAAVGTAFLTSRTANLPRSVTWLVVAGLLIATAAAAFSSKPFLALVGRAPRYEGIPMLVLYAGCAWAGARLLTQGVDRDTSSLVRVSFLCLSVVSLIIALIAVLETLGLRPLSASVARPGSLLGNASDEGALGVILAGVLGWAALRGAGRLVASGALASCLLVGLSASRAALLGLGVVATVLAVAAPRGQRYVIGAAVSLLAVLTLAAPASRARVAGTSPLATATAHGRILLWEESAALIARHPLLGVGPGGFIDSITREHDLAWQREVGPANPPDSPHDWILQAASSGGIPLLLVALGLSGTVVVAGSEAVAKARRDPASPDLQWKVGAFAGVAGYGVALLFGFTTPGTTPLAAFLAGAALGVPAVQRELRPAVARRYFLKVSAIVVPVAAYVMAAVAICGAGAEIALRVGLDNAANSELTRADVGFRDAHDLRPWDPAISQIAGHAMVTFAGLAPAGSADRHLALKLASPWIAAEVKGLHGNEQARVDEASQLELEGDFEQAAQWFEAALRNDPDNPALLLRLGVVRAEQGQLVGATAIFMRTAYIDPTSPDPWKDLAIVFQQQGNRGAAAKASARALRLEKGLP